MGRVHFVGGEKGGVGKSVLSRLLCQWCAERGVSSFAFDADPAQGKLLAGYGGHAVELASFRSVDRIMHQALDAECEVVVDLPAHSRAPLSRWLRESDVFGLAEEKGVQLVFWCVTDGGFDSVRSLEQLVRELPAAAEVVVVRNRRWASDFASFEGSELARELRGFGRRSIDLPALEPALMYELEARRTNWGQLLAASPSAPDGLGAMARHRFSLWLRRAVAQLESTLVPVSREVAPTAPEDERAGAKARSAEPGLPVELAQPPIQEVSMSSRRVWPAAGTHGSTGARTWTEVGDGYQVHHVRFP